MSEVLLNGVDGIASSPRGRPLPELEPIRDERHDAGARPRRIHAHVSGLIWKLGDARNELWTLERRYAGIVPAGDEDPAITLHLDAVEHPFALGDIPWPRIADFPVLHGWAGERSEHEAFSTLVPGDAIGRRE